MSTAMAPHVSVVIATHNRAELLPRAVASVLAQSFGDLELIVVDDGSKDDTAGVVRTLRDPRVRFIRHPQNRGLPASRNTGIRSARGRYVAFLDDDDQWVRQKLDRQLQAIRGHDAVLTGAYMTASRVVKTFANDRVTVQDLRRGNVFDPSSLMVNTDLMKALLFDESLRIGEDWDVFIRIAKAGSIAYLREPLLIYDDSRTGARMTTEASSLSLQDLERRASMLRKHEKFFGPFWMNYHLAASILSHIRLRADKLARLRYAVRRCGMVAVARLLFDRTCNALSPRRFLAITRDGLAPGLRTLR